jgi:hypothetical protein
MKYVDRKKTPLAGIPPGVEPDIVPCALCGKDSFRDEEERSISAPLGRAVKKT